MNTYILFWLDDEGTHEESYKEFRLAKERVEELKCDPHVKCPCVVEPGTWALIYQ
jgi:hypothetical protein